MDSFRNEQLFFIRATEGMAGGEIRLGDVLVVDPEAEITEGCRVLLRTQNGDFIKTYRENEKNEAIIYRVIKKLSGV